MEVPRPHAGREGPLRIDRVLWGQERFWLPGAPSFEPRPGPALPQFRDLFAQDGAPGKDWQEQGGAWAVAAGHLRQSDAAAPGRLLLKGHAASEYAFEVNLRGVGAGIYAYWKDEKNYVTAKMEPKALTVTAYDQGRVAFSQAFALPEGFRHDVWHQLTVRKNYTAFDFYVDDRKLGAATLAFAGPGQVGLATAAGATADFDGVALTHGWEDLAEQTIKPGAPVLKGAKDWGSYEFTASLRPASSGRYGLYAAYADAKNYVEVYLDPQRRSLVTLPVIKGKAGEEQATPVEINPEDWNAVTVIKNGFEFTIYVNGKQVQRRSIPIAKGQVGFFADGAEVHVDSVRAVRWD